MLLLLSLYRSGQLLLLLSRLLLLLRIPSTGYSLLLLLLLWLIHSVLSRSGWSDTTTGSTVILLLVILLLMLQMLLLRLPVHNVLLLLWIRASDHIVARRHQAVNHLTGKVEHTRRSALFVACCGGGDYGYWVVWRLLPPTAVPPPRFREFVVTRRHRLSLATGWLLLHFGLN